MVLQLVPRHLTRQAQRPISCVLASWPVVQRHNASTVKVPPQLFTARQLPSPAKPGLFTTRKQGYSVCSLTKMACLAKRAQAGLPTEIRSIVDVARAHHSSSLTYRLSARPVLHSPDFGVSDALSRRFGTSGILQQRQRPSAETRRTKEGDQQKPPTLYTRRCDKRYWDGFDAGKRENPRLKEMAFCIFVTWFFCAMSRAPIHKQRAPKSSTV